jgi:hypothetical protein
MVGFISEEVFLNITPLIDECLKILNGLINRYENNDLQ